MAKFMFLICILVALVHENLSKPSHPPLQWSRFYYCVENSKKLVALRGEKDELLKEKMALVMCFFEEHGIINDDKTVNLENLDEVAAEKGAKSNFRDCTYSVVAAAEPNDTKEDVNYAFAKCYVPFITS